ncbi:MAG: hypothetical protein A3J74_07300 [Elusimicrobia bacterium RIFCSPHIGHO2_02_FULL_57_9]|nr:MAG: hypothetical protein A3J74_07300 [Elusimicrobia bacterium RIFCSPHIGHO2_02_FULL_57_9]
MGPPRTESLEQHIKRLELRFRESAEELKELHGKLLRETRAEIDEIKDEWHGVHYKWWVITLSGLLALFMLSYFLYTQLGWVADQRTLPTGSDWLLRRLPTINVLPMLSWGWLALNLYAGGAAIAYYPRRIPFLLFVLSLFLAIRGVFIFLSPIGHPTGMMDMSKLDFLFSYLIGTWTFQNEFVFSGHTSIPFLFFLFFETFWLKLLLLSGSIVMAVCVLLSHNHYSVDVLGAYFVSYSIYVLAGKLYGYIQPLFLTLPSRDPY